MVCLDGAGFHLYSCNSLEMLAASYSSARKREPSCFRGKEGVFGREQIAVATRGMSIWLEQYLVRHGHVMAGIDFPFLRNAIDQILSRYGECHGERLNVEAARLTELFGEDVLIWRIFRLLCDESFMDEAGMSGLRTYLARHTDERSAELRRYELSVKLANLFYLYMAFLPEVLHPELAEGRSYRAYVASKGWQLKIWNRLCQDCAGQSPASLMLSFLRDSEEHLSVVGYEPMTFFGISAMPPYFLRVLKKLSTVTSVNFFYLNYCDDFWGDVKSDWERRQDQRQGIEDELDVHFNNTILGNLGIQGRQFFNALLDLTEEGVEERWEDIGQESQAEAETVLARLQAEIRGNVEDENGPMELPDWDDSLTFHACFHPTREVEVLHDCLLKLIERSQGEGGKPLKMNDIIVMAPDIGAYAAAIRCVFDQGPLRGRYSISDRSVQKANLLAATFMDILALSRGNFEYSKVTSLFGTDGLRNRFGITEEEAETLRDWLARAKVRHGDIAELPEGFSWRQGLDRFLMKIALDAPEDQPNNPLGLGQILPANIGTDGDSLALLSKLCAFMDALVNLVSDVRAGQRNGVEWCQYLLAQVPVFFLADSDCSEDYSALVRALRDLQRSMESGGMSGDGELPFAVVEAALSGVMRRPAQGEPFLNGKITFCSLMPMRGIPRRVIAIMGMNSGEFPRMETKVGFNLLSHARNEVETGDYNLLKYYDRSSVVEDNFTFLEAIMSAQEHLMLFFRGKDPLTLKPYPRAVPVDVLYESVCRLVGGVENAEHLVVEHSLNGYDPQAFRRQEGKKVMPAQAEVTLRDAFSYGLGAHLVARHLLQGRQSALPMALWQDMKELPLPDPLPFKVTADDHTDGRRVLCLEVTLKELEQYFRNPSERFLQRGLGFSALASFPAGESDYENYQTSHLEMGSLRKRIASVQSHVGDRLPLLGTSEDEGKLLEVLRSRLGAANALPLGAAGDLAFKELQRSSWLANDAFRAKFCAQEQSQPHDLDLLCRFPGRGDMPEAVTELIGVPFGDDVEFLVRLHGRFRYWQEGNEEGACGFMACEQHTIAEFRHPWGSWLRHLMLCEHYPHREVQSVVWGNPTGDAKRESETFKRPSWPMLERLLRVYVWGLVRPMPLFERSSWAGNPLRELPGEIRESADSRLLWGQFQNLEETVEKLGDYCSVREA